MDEQKDIDMVIQEDPFNENGSSNGAPIDLKIKGNMFEDIES